MVEAVWTRWREVLTGSQGLVAGAPWKFKRKLEIKVWDLWPELCGQGWERLHLRSHRPVGAAVLTGRKMMIGEDVRNQ